MVAENLKGRPPRSTSCPGSSRAFLLRFAASRRNGASASQSSRSSRGLVVLTIAEGDFVGRMRHGMVADGRGLPLLARLYDFDHCRVKVMHDNFSIDANDAIAGAS